MSPLFEAALEIQSFCRNQEWEFCIIGGLAVARWGEPRATLDVDVSLLTGLGNERTVIDQLLSQFHPREAGVAGFAVESRVLLVNAANKVPIDIALAAFPFEEQLIRRASDFRFSNDAAIRTASAEDIIVLKSFSGRDKDWLDVRGIVTRQNQRLDWDYTVENLQMLCEMNEDLSPLDRLAEFRQQ
ncbi:MAG: hypothetical protein O2820_14095 [Planctomycetota bacterium]|nr:hypothetical protein [Planctomycetota bacterium]MDA1250344.1 hypothetical protein [Planctomycetota bacterium]